MNDRVQPAERAYLVWAAPARGVGGMDAAVKPIWMYLRRPLAGAAQTCRGEKRRTGYTLNDTQPKSSNMYTNSAKARHGCWAFRQRQGSALCLDSKENGVNSIIRRVNAMDGQPFNGDQPSVYPELTRSSHFGPFL